MNEPSAERGRLRFAGVAKLVVISFSLIAGSIIGGEKAAILALLVFSLLLDAVLCFIQASELGGR